MEVLLKGFYLVNFHLLGWLVGPFGIFVDFLGLLDTTRFEGFVKTH